LLVGLKIYITSLFAAPDPPGPDEISSQSTLRGLFVKIMEKTNML